MGFILDQKKFSRRKRAFSGWTLLFGMVWAVHIWAYFYQKFVFKRSILILVKVPFLLRDYTRASLPANSPKLNIHSHGYAAKIWLYIFCGLLDAMWQITAYWIMGAMSNDPAKLAHFAGLCKWNGLSFIRVIDLRIR
jgi:exosortase/archaeosortase